MAFSSWSKDEFHVVGVHVCFPVQVRERLRHDPRVQPPVQFELFDLIGIVAEAGGFGL